MATRDWVIEAAEEIASRTRKRYDHAGRGLIAETVIRSHSPFKPDVAYMPVPRCETCAHWDCDNETTIGVCMMARSNSLNQKMWADMYDLIKTTADFGCVQWKAKT